MRNQLRFLLVLAVGFAPLSVASCGDDSSTGGIDASSSPDAPTTDTATSDQAAQDAVSDATTGDASNDGSSSDDSSDANSEGLDGPLATDSLMDTSPGAPAPPFGWVGVIGTGQSLSVGVTAAAMSTTQPFKNLKLIDNGPDPKYPIAADAGAPQWATTPLVEPIRGKLTGTGPGFGDGQYPDNIFGETPHSGMANTLSTLWSTRGGQGDYVTAHTVVGWSGHCLVDINKEGGKRAYPASLNEASVWARLASAAGKTFGVGGIVLTHGECDASNAAYGAGLFQLWQDYDSDLKAITGQTRDVVLVASQQSTIATGAGGSAVQVWQAGVAHPGQVVCAGPKYQYQYSADNLHLPAPGYERLGQKYAEVFDLVVNQGATWKPLQPNKVTRAGAVITIDFDVPSPPLVWDSHIAPPHQTANTEWAAGKGFEVKDSGGHPLTISKATIQGSSVVLTLAADPGTGKVTVGYAVTQEGTGNQGGTNLGLRGLLRDSDEFVGYDAETIPSTVTQGSAILTTATPNGFVHRTGHDIVSGAGVAPDTVVSTHDTDAQVTLSTPWTGVSGSVLLSFRHDERNYCVHFSLSEQ
jgi:hypothetical protein